MKLIGNEVEPGEALRKVLGSQPAARSQNEAEYDQKKQLHPSQTRLNKSLSQTTEQNGTHPKAQTTTQPITEMNKLRSQLNPALQPVSSTTTADLSCLLCEKRSMTSEPSCQDSLPDADVCKDGEDQDGDPAADRVPNLQLRLHWERQSSCDAPLCLSPKLRHHYHYILLSRL